MGSGAHVGQDGFGRGGWVWGLSDGAAYYQIRRAGGDGVGWRDHAGLVGMGFAGRADAWSDDGEVLAELVTELGGFLGAGYDAVTSTHDCEIGEQDYLVFNLSRDSGHLEIMVVHAGEDGDS